jgi:hypothetical protein
MNLNEVATPLQSAVLEYFAGERQEMLLILGGSLLVTVLVLWLWIITRTDFAAAFAITVIATAALFSGTAVSLLARDNGVSNTIVQALGTERQTASLTGERERIAVVRSKYRYYRYASSVIASIAILGLAILNRGWVHGVAAGLLLLVVAQILIDHYSERRADRYFQRLTMSTESLAHSTI